MKNTTNSLFGQMMAKGEAFRIGIKYDLVKDDAKFKALGFSKNFIEGFSMIPRKCGPKTKANIGGLYERVMPGERVTVERFIEYTNKYGTHVAFYRNYNVYKKNLVDPLMKRFYLETDAEGVRYIVSEKLTFNLDPISEKINTHVVNLFLEAFNSFDILRENLSPFIKFGKDMEAPVLPSGHRLSDQNFRKFIEYAEKKISKRDRKPLIERARVLKEFSPTIRKAPGLNGYLAFVFEEKGIVAAESIKANNATYFFDMADYEDNLMKDKQRVLRERLAKKRFYHSKDSKWEHKVRKFLNGI